MVENRTTAPQARATVAYLLAGLIKCGHCGGSYVGFQSTPRATGRTIRGYRCNWRSNQSGKPERAKCDGKFVTATWLEGNVWERVSGIIRSPGPWLEEARRVMLAAQPVRQSTEDAERQLREALAETMRGRERLLDLYRRGLISQRDIEPQLAASGEEERALRQRLEAMQHVEQTTEAGVAYLSSLALTLANAAEGMDEADGDEALKRRLIALVVERITLTTGPGERKKVAGAVLRTRLGVAVAF